MCVASKPQINAKEAAADAKKPLPILRNPFLDGLLGNVAAARGGRNALRIDLINPLAIPTGGPSGGGVSIGGGSGSGSSGGSGVDVSGSSVSPGGYAGGSTGRGFRTVSA